jgi:hypothetical protein
MPYPPEAQAGMDERRRTAAATSEWNPREVIPYLRVRSVALKWATQIIIK